MAETPHFLKALGRQPLPAELDIQGNIYRLERTFKNDFFAVTALYRICDEAQKVILSGAKDLPRETGCASAGPEAVRQDAPSFTTVPVPSKERDSIAIAATGLTAADLSRPPKVILKVSRQASFFGLPMGWIGRILAAKEQAALRQLEDLEGIPRLVGNWGPTGIVREFIEGRHLARGMHVADDFHPQLRSLIGEIHNRGMAYVDLEKAENVLVSEDGKPYLFDFQISWYLPRRWGGELLPARLIRRWLQRGDLYHLVKLQRRTRPDQLTEEALAASYRKPSIVRVYRFLSYPFTWVRRRILQWIDPRRAPGERGRVMGDCP